MRLFCAAFQLYPAEPRKTLALNSTQEGDVTSDLCGEFILNLSLSCQLG